MNLELDSDDIFGLLNEEIIAWVFDVIPSFQLFTQEVTSNIKDLANSVP
jgi:hypothetical protein